MLHSLSKDFKSLIYAPYGLMAALGIFFIPIDSAWFFPVDAVYRPIWILPFVFIGIIKFLTSLHLYKKDIYVICMSSYAVLSSIIAAFIFSYVDYSGIYKTCIVSFAIIFGVIGINSFLYSLSRKFGITNALRIIASSILMLSIFPILLGFMQIPGELFGFNSVNKAIQSLFSYRYTPGRIHLLSGEPSWAARYILFVLIMSLFVSARFVQLIRFFLLILLLFTGSALGIITGLFLFVAYGVINNNINKSGVLRFALFSLFIISALMNYRIIFSFSPYAIDKMEKTFSLISNISFEQIMIVASLDGSILARIVNPIIALDLASTYPLGIGGESFKFWILEKLQEYGYSGESSFDYILAAGSTPKLLVAKILVEFGIIIFGILLFNFIKLYSAVKCGKLKFMLISVPIMTISDDSYLFYGLIFPLCLVSMVSRAKNTTVL